MSVCFVNATNIRRKQYAIAMETDRQTEPLFDGDKEIDILPATVRQLVSRWNSGVRMNGDRQKDAVLTKHRNNNIIIIIESSYHKKRNPFVNSIRRRRRHNRRRQARRQRQWEWFCCRCHCRRNSHMYYYDNEYSSVPALVSLCVVTRLGLNMTKYFPAHSFIVSSANTLTLSQNNANFRFTADEDDDVHVDVGW